ncbi:S46 family peptidase [bacterium]|nr:S46 family peptidase [bacterium]
MKSIRIAALLVGFVFLAVSASAGELAYQPGGMWMPQQIADVHADTLRKMGLKFDPQNFGDMLAFPLNAVVSLGGASASFVSPDGLCITNHHCVRGYLQYNSKEGRNLVVDGYLARSRKEELPCGPTARVFVTTAVTDVTDRVLGGLKDVADDLERFKTATKRQKEIVKEAEAAAPGTRCEVVTFYGGAKYYLITRLELRDVRLVWAPHEGIGFFGGEIDNWMWPRHDGDFGLVRAYVGRDGKPADYSKKNVPYKPKSYFRLAPKGIQEGDLAMVIGYPGRTMRLMTAYEMSQFVGWEMPRQLDQAQRQIDLVRKTVDGDEALAIKASGMLFGLENRNKKRGGMLEAARTSGLEQKKAADEKKLIDWIAATPEREQKYGGVVEEIDEIVKEHEQGRETRLAFGNIIGGSSLLSAAITIARLAEERPKPDLEREPGLQQRDWQRIEQAQERNQKDYDRRIDEAVFEFFLREAAKLPADQRPAIFNDIMGAGPATADAIHARVAGLYDKTGLANLNTRLKLIRAADTAALKKSKDPMIQFALKALPVIKAEEDRSKRAAGAMLFLRPLYFEALSEFNNGRIAPDANGTIRVTFGTVRGFSPVAGRPVCFPFTNVWQMAEKWARNKGEAPYNAPQKLIAAINERRFGPYADAKAGGVPVDFLTDLDITNGNSGSPTLNAAGEFAGIVFDGNIEGVGSDLVFQPDVTRGIHADVRYLEWLLDAVDGGGYLLREMGVKPVFCE